MSEFDSERLTPWTYYTSLNMTTSSVNVDGEGRLPWLVSPMNAISLGFVVTAILVSLFLIMAIFEHLFGQIPSFTSPEPLRFLCGKCRVSREIQAFMLGRVHECVGNYGDDARGSLSDIHCTTCPSSAILSERRNRLASPSPP